MAQQFDAMAKLSEQTKRTTIVLPGSIYDALGDWADEEGRPTANLAAFLIEQAVRIKYFDKFPPRVKEVKVNDRHAD